MLGKKDCESKTPKKCKEPKVILKQESECVEDALPADYEEKTYFKLDSNDQIEQERAKCLENCHVKPVFEILKECEKRVTRKLLYTAETCHEETIYLMEALDECVRDKGFKRLE